MNRRDEPGAFVRHCGLYLSRDGTTAIVASTYNRGMIVEKPGGATTCPISGVEHLGELIKQKLAECERQEGRFDYSKDKQSDWPAYQASGVKTLRRFKNDFVRYLISGANSFNVTWQITSPEFHNGIELQSALAVGMDARAMGEWVIRLHQFFLDVERIA